METVAVGFFDGVHVGHQAILRGASRVVTFRNHPLSVLCPARAPRLIMSADERLAALRAQAGVREVVALDFTPAFAALPPDEFARAFLGSARVQCGENWTFGAKGVGNAALLRALGYEVNVVAPVLFDGARVSSTRIRATLEQGLIKEAVAMLGHDFRVTGTRFAGKGEGRRLGFPTVNVRPTHLELKLPRGVYVVAVDGHRALANYGVAPTFDDRAWASPVFEVHFPFSDASFLDGRETVAVELLTFIRPERIFPSVDDLKAQISRDVAAFQAFVNAYKPNLIFDR